MGQGKNTTKWCTGRECSVNCMTVISARWRLNMAFQRRRNWHIPMASYRKRSRKRAWLTIWDKVKIPPYPHKVMHRKRVTCELHDSYFRLWRLNMPFQRRRKWHIPMANYEKKSQGRGGVSISPRGSLMVILGRRIERKTVKNSAVHASLSRRYPMCVFSAIVYLHRGVQTS